jgi:hypothetical protein
VNVGLTYSRPTIAEVVMWLWEKHNIWIEVRLSYQSNKFVVITKNPRVELNVTNTPTQAYEAAIKHCLSLINDKFFTDENRS